MIRDERKKNFENELLWHTLQLYYKRTPEKVFSCKFCNNSENSFSAEHSRTISYNYYYSSPFITHHFFLVSTILSTLNKKQNLTLHIWLHLLKKSLMENFISCAVLLVIFFKLKSLKYSERITSFMRFRDITQCIHKTKGMGKLLSKKSEYR